MKRDIPAILYETLNEAEFKKAKAILAKLKTDESETNS